jgi:predicted Zn-dependent protease
LESTVRNDFVRSVAVAGASLVTAVLGACDAPLMAVDDVGYDPLGLVPFVYHWSPGHEIAIYVDKRGEPSGVDIEAAVKAGIAAWESVAFLGEVRMKVVADVHEADVIVHHADAPGLITVDLEQCPPPADLGGGRTYFCILENASGRHTTSVLLLNDGSGGHVKMDVRVNVGAISDPEFFDAIVAHELGHVLGIGTHSSNNADLMFGTPRVFVPSDDDAAALRYVLSRPAAARF